VGTSQGSRFGMSYSSFFILETGTTINSVKVINIWRQKNTDFSVFLGGIDCHSTQILLRYDLLEKISCLAQMMTSFIKDQEAVLTR
jgi:hypothetical protein